MAKSIWGDAGGSLPAADGALGVCGQHRLRAKSSLDGALPADLSPLFVVLRRADLRKVHLLDRLFVGGLGPRRDPFPVPPPHGNPPFRAADALARTALPNAIRRAGKVHDQLVYVSVRHFFAAEAARLRDAAALQPSRRLLCCGKAAVHCVRLFPIIIISNGWKVARALF